MLDQRIHVLLVEDDLEQARGLQELLVAIPVRRFIVTHHASLEAAAGALRAPTCDVALLGLGLGGSPPAQAVRLLRDANPRVPILVLCRLDAELSAGSLLAAGACDYLIREGLTARELARALCNAADRRRDDDALQRERDLLRTLIDNLPDHIYVKDDQSRFLLNNAAHIKSLGASSAEELLGKTDLDVFPAGIGDPFFAEEREILRTGTPLIGREERNIDAAGVEHWVSSTKVPRRDESGRIIGLVGMSRDITARIRAEQMLQAQNARLEATLGSERAALEELKRAQSHLVQAEKLAGLGQMVAGIAHEINNPLAFVINNVAVARRDMAALCELLTLYRSEADACLGRHHPELLARVQEIAERIDLDYTLGNLIELMSRSRDGLDRIRHIVTDLRDFARLDDSDLQAADLNAGIASSINIIAAGAARTRGVRIDLLPGDIPLVACYPGKINQVVMNLLSNAIDASPPGATVTVQTRGTTECVEVIVSDTGAGIDPAIRGRIFDPFFTTKAPGQGTGLGLSISYAIVRDHFGEIVVESTRGQGATFVVRLPVRRANGGGET